MSNTPRPVSSRIFAVASSRVSPLTLQTASTPIWPPCLRARRMTDSEKPRSSVSASTRARLRPAAMSARPATAGSAPNTATAIRFENMPPRPVSSGPMNTSPPKMPNTSSTAPPKKSMVPVFMAGPYWNETLGTAFVPASALKYSLWSGNPPMRAHHAPGMPRTSLLYCFREHHQLGDGALELVGALDLVGA